MSEKIAHCPFCGSAVEEGAKFCQNCGASLDSTMSSRESEVKIIPETPVATTEPASSTDVYGTDSTSFPQEAQGYQQGTTPYSRPTPTTYIQTVKRDDSSGTIALVFGILACVGILPCIGSILAIVFGGKSDTSNGRVGRTLGIIALCLNIIGVILLIILWF